jgi:hypothetical protein
VGQPSPQPHNSIYLPAQTLPTPRPVVAVWLAHSLCIAKMQDQVHLSLMDLTLVGLFRDKPARRLAPEPPAIGPVEPQSAERARGERNIARRESSLSPSCRVLRHSSAIFLPSRCCARDIRNSTPKIYYRRSRTLAALSASHHHKLGNPDIPYFGSGSGWLKRSQRATRSLL